mgnify:CR=1 FL=1
MRLQARTPTAECCTRREIGPVDVGDEASRCAMEAADETKEEGIEVMPTAIPDPPEIRESKILHVIFNIPYQARFCIPWQRDLKAYATVYPWSILWNTTILHKM